MITFSVLSLVISNFANENERCFFFYECTYAVFCLDMNGKGSIYNPPRLFRVNLNNGHFYLTITDGLRPTDLPADSLTFRGNGGASPRQNGSVIPSSSRPAESPRPATSRAPSMVHQSGSNSDIQILQGLTNNTPSTGNNVNHNRFIFIVRNLGTIHKG